MPRFAKGSQEAKDYMKMIREKKKSITNIEYETASGEKTQKKFYTSTDKKIETLPNGDKIVKTTSKKMKEKPQRKEREQEPTDDGFEDLGENVVISHSPLEETPTQEPKRKGRKQKYATEEERKKAKREQTLASNKKKRAERKQAKEAEGKGLIEDIQKGFKKGVQTIKSGVENVGQKIKSGAETAIKKVEEYGKAIIYGREDYPPKVRDILKQYGSEIVSGLTIMRTPVPKVLTGALSIFSGGKFGKRMENAFDDLFHLFLEIRTQSGKRLSVEKNEVINMDINPSKRDKTETKEVSNIPSGLSIDAMMDATEKHMGKQRYFSYSAKDNNCQDFIVAIFKANAIGDESDISFIKQDTKQLFKDLPYLRKFANTITDIGGRFNVITTGAGVEEIKNYGMILNHLTSHITDPNEPIDPKDYAQSVKIIDAIRQQKEGMKGKGLEMPAYVVQSVIFTKDTWTTPKAKKWLKEHTYSGLKVDKKEEHLRFRQIDPDEVEKMGYTEYRTKPLGEASGISLILAYRKNKISKKSIKMPRKPKMKGEGAIPTQLLIEREMQGKKRVYGGEICSVCKHIIEHHIHSDSDSDIENKEMEGGKINIAGAFKKLGSDIKKGFTKDIIQPAEKTLVPIADKTAEYITAKKGGLATDLIKYGIPAVSSATLGGLATLATGGNPVAGVAGSALGSKLGAVGASALEKATGTGLGTGMRKGRFVKGSEEAKEHMRRLREKRGKN